MSAAKQSTKKSGRASAGSAARSAATSAAKSAAAGAAKSAAKTAAKGAAKGAGKASKSAIAAGGDRLGRGTRWTEEQVKLLLDTVDASGTAKEAFETVARELGKSAGTVAQKYYNLQKAKPAAARSTSPRRGRPVGSGSASRAARTGSGSSSARTSGGLPGAADLKVITVDELVGLAARVKTEIDRRRDELDAAAKALGS